MLIFNSVNDIDATALEVLESLDTMAQRMNLAITIGELHVDQESADKETAGGLGIAEGNRVTRIRRTMCADGRPVAYLLDTMPADLLDPGELPENFSGSVLDFMLGRGDSLTVSRAAISATNATADVAKALEIQRGDVLLEFISQLYNNDSKIVDYTVSYFIPGYFNFHVVRRVGNG